MANLRRWMLPAHGITVRRLVPSLFFFTPAELDDDVFTFGETCLFESLTKCCQMIRLRRRLSAVEKPNHRHGLLRVRTERPRHGRATEKRDQFPSPHEPFPCQRTTHYHIEWQILCMTAKLTGRRPLRVISDQFAMSVRCPLLPDGDQTATEPGLRPTCPRQRASFGKQRTVFSTTQFRYLKVIRSVRLSVEALFFKASFAAFSLC